jgi:cell division protein FtsB
MNASVCPGAQSNHAPPPGHGLQSSRNALIAEHNAQMSLRSWFVIGSEFKEMIAAQKEDRAQMQALHAKIEQLHELDRQSFDIMSRSQTGLCVLVEQLQKRVHKLEQQAVIHKQCQPDRTLCERCTRDAARPQHTRDAPD